MSNLPSAPLREDLLKRYPDITDTNCYKAHKIKDLAFAAGVSKRTINRILAGENISHITVDKICTNLLGDHPGCYYKSWLEITTETIQEEVLKRYPDIKKNSVRKNYRMEDVAKTAGICKYTLGKFLSGRQVSSQTIDKVCLNLLANPTRVYCEGW